MNEKRQSIDTNTEITKILALFEIDFKTAIKRLQVSNHACMQLKQAKE